MKAAILAGLFGFGAALAVSLGWRMGGEVEALTGVFVGIVASIPVVVVLVILHRANDAMTQKTLSGIVPQRAPERATGHPWAFSDAGARVGPALGATGHSTRPFADVDLLRHYVDRGRDGPVIDGQWREYAATTPHIAREFHNAPL